MYPSAVGHKFLIQYTVSGTGFFDGTEYGRARLTVDPGLGADSVVYFASKLYGSASNALTVEYVDAGPGVIVGATTVTQIGPAIRVLLRRSAAAVLATAAEVAAAVNAFTAYNSPGYAISARAGGNGTGVVAAIGPLSFTGGADPIRVGSQFLWTVPTNGNAGFVHLENSFPMWILGFSARFNVLLPGPFTVSLARVRLEPDFTPILSEAVNFFVFNGLTPSAPDIAYTDVKQLIHPGQGILVTTSAPLTGFFNIDVTRAAEFPYA
jgi:hypothetical protein